VEKGVKIVGGVEKGVVVEEDVEMAGWRRVSKWRGGEGCRDGGEGCRDGRVEKGVEMAWWRRVSRWRGGKGCRDGGVEKGVEMAGKVSAVFTWCQLWCGVPGIMEHLTRAAGNSTRAFLLFHPIAPTAFTRHSRELPPIGNSETKQAKEKG
jgi:hypothetical protein